MSLNRGSYDLLDPALTALDIETDTSGGGGLDPTASHVTAVALAFSDANPLVFDGADERVILQSVADVLRVRRGLLVTWNGSGFDIPFILKRSQSLGLDLGLNTWLDSSIPVKYAAPAGLGGPLRGTWFSLKHLDIAPLYRDLSLRENIGWSLKPVARHLGLHPVEVDRTSMHALTREELQEYVVSDARVTLELAALLGSEILTSAML